MEEHIRQWCECCTAHPHAELPFLAIVMLFSFQVKWEILQVDVKRATEKRDNSASIWNFNCSRGSLECDLHSTEIFRVTQSFKDRITGKMGALGMPVKALAINGWISHVG